MSVFRDDIEEIKQDLFNLSTKIKRVLEQPEAKTFAVKDGEYRESAAIFLGAFVGRLDFAHRMTVRLLEVIPKKSRRKKVDSV